MDNRAIYRYRSVGVEGKRLNRSCADIVNSKSYKKMLEVANAGNIDESMKLEFLVTSNVGRSTGVYLRKWMQKNLKT